MSDIFRYLDKEDYRNIKYTDDMLEKAKLIFKKTILEKTIDKQDLYVECICNFYKNICTNDEIITILLHNVLEAEKINPLDLREMRFSDDVIKAAKILQKKENETYCDYIDRVFSSKNDIAINIKTMDLNKKSPNKVKGKTLIERKK